MRRVFQLRMSQQRVENAQVRMSEGNSLFGQIEDIANENVDKDVEVVGVKVFVGVGGCKDEVKEFQCQEL